MKEGAVLIIRLLIIVVFACGICGCSSHRLSSAHVDLVDPVADAIPVYIHPVVLSPGLEPKGIQQEERSIEELMRELLVSALHKKGFRVVDTCLDDCVEVKAVVEQFSAEKYVRKRRKRPGLLDGIAAMGMTTLGPRYETSRPYSVLEIRGKAILLRESEPLRTIRLNAKARDEGKGDAAFFEGAIAALESHLFQYMPYASRLVGELGGPAGSATLVEGDKGLMLHYSFDEDTGKTIRDSSVYERHGVAHNRVEWSPKGVSGGAIVFRRGFRAYIEATDFDVGDDFTLSCWILPYRYQHERRVDQLYGQAFIAKNGLDGANHILCGYYSGGYDSRGLSMRINEAVHREGKISGDWQQMTYVAKAVETGSTDVTIYRNGRVIWRKILDARPGDISGRPWCFGQEWDESGPSDHFRGRMDEIRIYNYALSPAAVRSLYYNDKSAP